MNELNYALGAVTVVAFVVSIIVQLTKGFIPLPTQLWTILVSVTVMLTALLVGVSYGVLIINTANVAMAIVGSFVIAYISMNGFDTFKNLWKRFKEGNDIDEQQ